MGNGGKHWDRDIFGAGHCHNNIVPFERFKNSFLVKQIKSESHLIFPIYFMIPYPRRNVNHARHPQMCMLCACKKGVEKENDWVFCLVFHSVHKL